VNGSAVDAPKAISMQQTRSLIILDRRALNRECFVKVLDAHQLGLQPFAFETMDDWKKEKDSLPPAGAVLVSVGGSEVGSEAFLTELTEIAAELTGTPVIVLSDSDDLSCILQVIDCGTQGYIPTSLGMAVCAEAIRLAMVGGTFVPASAVMTMRHKFKARPEEERPMTSLFTQRQVEVAQALRRGKANKIIAYELNLRESTVKVHIRNIMKKLKATNRTEVAFKINQLMADQNRTFQ
jgi:DNA-binding NarL/FixJ family response regulator